MKRGVEHIVPLSGRALAIVRELKALRPQAKLVFAASHGGQMSRAAVWALACRLSNVKSTVHGLRSSFRSWCSDHSVPFEVAEACLAHPRRRSVRQIKHGRASTARHAAVGQLPRREARRQRHRPSSPAGCAMIRITITQAAFDVIAAMQPFGSVAYEAGVA
jgi:integrase